MAIPEINLTAVAEPDAPPAVFFCVQIKLTVGGCEYLEEREYRYSQFKVLHYRLLLVDKIAPDTLAAFPFAAKSTEDRRVAFEAYLQAIVADPSAVETDTFRAFMRLNSRAKGRRTSSFLGVGGIAGAAASVLLPFAPNVRSTVRCAEKQLSTMRFPPAAEVLDLGAGPGLMTVLACRRHRGCTCTALDSFDAVMRADLESNMIAEFINHRVTIVESSPMLTLPFANNSFDVLLSSFCIGMLESAEARTAVLDEIVRVLRPGGLLLIIDWNASSSRKHLASHGLDVTVSGLQPSFLPMRVRFIRSCASVGSEGGSEGAVDDIGNDSENESTIDGSNGGDIACDESGDMSTDELELIDRSAKDCEPSDLNSACEVDCVPPASPLPSSLNSLTSTVSTRLSSQSLFDTDDRPGTPVGQWWSEDPGNWFTKEAERWGLPRKRFFQLERAQGRVAYYTSQIDGKLKGTIPFDIIKRVEQTGASLVIDVGRREYSLTADDITVAAMWCRMLQDAIGAVRSTLVFNDVSDLEDEYDATASPDPQPTAESSAGSSRGPVDVAPPITRR